MNPYERMQLVLKGKLNELDRVPCSPYTGVFTVDALEKAGVKWIDAFKTTDGMVKIIKTVHEHTGLESVTVGFDAVVEAEMLGLMPDFREKQAARGKYIWPTIKVKGVTMSGRRLDTPADLDAVIPEDVASAGRMPMMLEAVKRLHEEYYGEIPVCGRVGGPFTILAGYIMDTVQFMMKVVTEPEVVKEFYDVYKRMTIEEVKLFFEAGADIVSVAEDGAGCDNLAPAQFRDIVKPRLKKIFDKSGANAMTMSGTAGPIIKDCAELGAKIITVDEKTDVVKAKKDLEEMRPQHFMALAGDIPTINVLAKGTPEQVRNYVKDLIERKGIELVSPGSDLFITTPLENVKAMVDAVKEFGVRK
ncbi:MAG TPA: hypothetical protein ENF26_04050 [Methanomicrobia archaeon]|nr:hypothetical protein [Methanomicrobia archaeon]HEX59304.1 hypothetical protein [Methanomicrobia archaeon]